ncbi:MAG: GAD-like domain-containing protein, partial [Bacillota bacterium]|nr:GAD-like domain-containing protein [Bacillota bacterium]
MDEHLEKVFNDFKLYQKVPESTIDKYKSIVGEDVVEIWEKYGFGNTFNGYLKIINPDDIQSLLEETYIMPLDEIPVFVTGMGDIIVC